MKIGFACLVRHRRRCKLTRLALCKNFLSFLPFEILAEIIIQLWHDFPAAKLNVFATRTHFEVLGLGLEASSPRNLPCPRLEDSTICEPLKFCWKTPETSLKICEHLFCFPQLEHRRSQRGGGGQVREPAPLLIEISPITRMCQKSVLFLRFQFLFSIFHLQH